MNDIDSTRRGRRRIARIGVPFAVGAAAGAAALAGLGGGTAAPPSTAKAASPSAVVSTAVTRSSALYDAQTIYTRDSPGVVDITVTSTSQGAAQGLSPFVPGNGAPRSQAEGTGFVYDKSGNIVTAAHVVEGASGIAVRFTDGTTAKATLVGTDPSSDTAVIHVSVPAGKLTPLALADSSTVRPGQGVVAIGSPFGYESSITAGIVSAVDRAIDAPNGYSIANAIQTDAAINHGNSGGPLIDASGRVIGVNVQIATDSQVGGGSDNAGVGFAVPSNTVKKVAADLIAGRAVQHAYLGVSVTDGTSVAGARIGTVRAGSPAARAGLEAGDVVTAVDGAAISGASELTAAVGQHEPGDRLRLTVERAGGTLVIEATLGTRPATPPSA